MSALSLGRASRVLLLLPLASVLWAQSPSPSPSSASLRGLSVAPDGAIWASGTNGTVLRSTDAGRSWAPRSIADAAALDLRDIEAVSATTAYAMVAGADTARIYRTTDGGKQWVRQYDDTRRGVFLDGIAFWDASNGLAVGDPLDGHFLVLRTDDGTHWTELSAAASPKAAPGEAAFAASGTAVAVAPGGHAWIGTGGASESGAAARVFRSSDHGRTWQASSTPIPAGSPSTGIFSLAFRDSLNGVAVGGDYAHPGTRRPNVAVTSDGGVTWQLADSAQATGYLSAVAYASRDGRALVGVGTSGTFTSLDGGRTWARRDSLSYNAIAALSSGSLVAVGEGGRSGVLPGPAPKSERSTGFGVRAAHAMISSSSEPASLAGLAILRRGGNAVDAAVAVGFALAVTLPAAGNLGGGGFMVLHLADGRTAALDFREVAPLAASRDMYLDARGYHTDRSLVGHLASGVPGSVAGLTEAQRRYGKLPLGEVIAPALRLARDRFTVDSALARSLAGARPLISKFSGAGTFLPHGVPPAPGSVLKQPALATTLERIATSGADAFYRGPIADQIVGEMQRGRGIITREDLARYRALWRDPIEGSYRGYRLITMPPPSSGGISLVEILNILETRPALPPAGGSMALHLLAEAFRRAFVDRNTRLGDPAFVRVPVAELTSKPYAARLAATIAPGRATPSPAFSAAVPGGTHTTSYSVVDAQGNAVAVTVTLNSSYGSGVYVREAGFFLNNEMDDFATVVGRPNQFGLIEGENNTIVPGKRMLSSMTPTIVLDSAGGIGLVLGAAGGPTIITAVAQVILNVVDYHMPLDQAVAAGRIHQQAWPDSVAYERNRFSTEVLDSLRAMGYALDEEGSIATLNALMWSDGGYVGVGEPRFSAGGPAGY
jgi:gamma-glutamyltranspeptidase / glutathione hydrolase